MDASPTKHNSRDNPAYFDFPDTASASGLTASEALENLHQVADKIYQQTGILPTGKKRKRRSFREFMTNSLGRSNSGGSGSTKKKKAKGSCGRERTTSFGDQDYEEKLAGILRTASLERDDLDHQENSRGQERSWIRRAFSRGHASLPTTPTSPPLRHNYYKEDLEWTSHHTFHKSPERTLSGGDAPLVFAPPPKRPKDCSKAESIPHARSMSMSSAQQGLRKQSSSHHHQPDSSTTIPLAIPQYTLHKECRRRLLESEQLEESFWADIVLLHSGRCQVSKDWCQYIKRFFTANPLGETYSVELQEVEEFSKCLSEGNAQRLLRIEERARHAHAQVMIVAPDLLNWIQRWPNIVTGRYLDPLYWKKTPFCLHVCLFVLSRSKRQADRHCLHIPFLITQLYFCLPHAGRVVEDFKVLILLLGVAESDVEVVHRASLLSFPNWRKLSVAPNSQRFIEEMIQEIQRTLRHNKPPPMTSIKSQATTIMSVPAAEIGRKKAQEKGDEPSPPYLTAVEGEKVSEGTQRIQEVLRDLESAKSIDELDGKLCKAAKDGEVPMELLLAVGASLKSKLDASNAAKMEEDKRKSALLLHWAKELGLNGLAGVISQSADLSNVDILPKMEDKATEILPKENMDTSEPPKPKQKSSPGYIPMKKSDMRRTTSERTVYVGHQPQPPRRALFTTVEDEDRENNMEVAECMKEVSTVKVDWKMRLTDSRPQSRQEILHSLAVKVS